MSTRSTSYRYSQEFNNDDYNQMRAPNRIPDIVVGNFIHDDRESLFQAVDIFTNGQKFRIDLVRNNASGLHTAFIKCVNDYLHPDLFEFLGGLEGCT